MAEERNAGLHTIRMRIITDSSPGKATWTLPVADNAPTYTELLAERYMLLKRIDQLHNEKQAVWDIVEDVATGAALLPK